MQVIVNGKTIEAAEGDSILKIAEANDIHIPTLCYLKKLSPIGSCRMCVVEVEGLEKPVTACDTPAVNGMVIQTDTPKLRDMRREILRFLLVNHPLECPFCDKAGECMLQDLVYEYLDDVQQFLVSIPGKQYKEYATPAIVYHPNRCVVCSRCVRACREIVGRSVLDLVNKGYETRVEAVAPERCISCGECLSVCPVGALTEHVSERKGRVWYAKKVPTVCGYCGVGCAIELNIYDDKVIKVTTDEEAGPNNGSLCVKGRFGYGFITSPDRIKTPMIRKNGSLQEATWDEALNYAARNLKRIKEDHGPDSVAGLTSARCTNEDNYVFQKFMRATIGTNNIDHCARL